MADIIRYDLLVQQAMRDVVRKVLEDVIKAGQKLPGNHHFYITFDTTHPHSVISDKLKEQHPDQMTIVLQHQFWGLKVTEERIEVSLSFDQTPEHLCIPFKALLGFYDPSASFGLQLEIIGEYSDPLAGGYIGKASLEEMSGDNDQNEKNIDATS